MLQNNIMSHNLQWGMMADDSEFAVRQYNAYFGNRSGTCDACSGLGNGSLTDDPVYLDAAGYDFRLQPSSTLINAGTDTGYDVNGPAPGNGLFNDTAPDIGAFESP